MDRRQFLSLSAAGLLGLGLTGPGALLEARNRKKADAEYNMVILGDTHFDTEPASVYHAHYNEPTEWLNRVQRAEFARNGEMWRERCPRLLKRAACLVDEQTKMALQMGDLIQGDCGSGEVHKKMLFDVMDRFKGEFGGLPFVTVVGNHDIRGTDAKKVYHAEMPLRMSRELGKDIRKTTFSFAVGDDAFLVIDFNHPDDAETERLLADCAGARNTFVVIHGPLLPFDSGNPRWFYHGKNKPEHTEARRHFRREFSRRNVICLCGHVHRTEFADWRGDGGRITQMTMTSVWSDPLADRFEIACEGAASYGELRKEMPFLPNGKPIADESALFDEYRPGLRQYLVSPTPGSYKLFVKGRRVHIDFYAGDSPLLSRRFILR